MIRISKMADYGIVLLSHFARDPKRTVLNARDLAFESKLPLPTVSKILKVLSRGELLVSERGVNGGYRLAKGPEAISVAEIIGQLDGPIGITECSGHAPGLCEYESICRVRNNWRKINKVVSSALENLTLSDMVAPATANFARSAVQ